eukprot:scaffold181408_cov39-Tisochrysis_lutea.AAC.2
MAVLPLSMHNQMRWHAQRTRAPHENSGNKLRGTLRTVFVGAPARGTTAPCRDGRARSPALDGASWSAAPNAPYFGRSFLLSPSSPSVYNVAIFITIKE